MGRGVALRVSVRIGNGTGNKKGNIRNRYNGGVYRKITSRGQTQFIHFRPYIFGVKARVSASPYRCSATVCWGEAEAVTLSIV